VLECWGGGLVAVGDVLNGESGPGMCVLAASIKESGDARTGVSGDVRVSSTSLLSSALLPWLCVAVCVSECALVILRCCFHFLTEALLPNTYR